MIIHIIWSNPLVAVQRSFWTVCWTCGRTTWCGSRAPSSSPPCWTSSPSPSAHPTARQQTASSSTCCLVDYSTVTYFPILFYLLPLGIFCTIFLVLGTVPGTVLSIEIVLYEWPFSPLYLLLFGDFLHNFSSFRYRTWYSAVKKSYISDPFFLFYLLLIGDFCTIFPVLGTVSGTRQ